MYVLSRGDIRECPFCRYEGEDFKPFGVASPAFTRHRIVGGGYRPHVLCPRCGSTDRERLVFCFLKKHTNVFLGTEKVLHVAPEHVLGGLLKIVVTEYLSIDIRPNIAMRVADIRSLPFAPGSFDAIICNHVLEHVQDDIKALSELLRVLSSNGIAVLQVPIALDLPHTLEAHSSSPEEREALYGQSDHVRLYGTDYPQRLMKAGFKVVTYDPSHESDLDLRRKYSLLPNEVVFAAIKNSNNGISDSPMH